MNYDLLANEVRTLAGGDVDVEIQFSGMTDKEIVQHVVTCPCCEERSVSDEQLDDIVTDSTSLEDFINRYNDTQKSYPLTETEVAVVETILAAALRTAVASVANMRHVGEHAQDAIDNIANQVSGIAHSVVDDEFFGI